MFILYLLQRSWQPPKLKSKLFGGNSLPSSPDVLTKRTIRTSSPHTGSTGSPHTGSPHTGSPHIGAPHTRSPLDLAKDHSYCDFVDKSSELFSSSFNADRGPDTGTEIGTGAGAVADIRHDDTQHGSKISIIFNKFRLKLNSLSIRWKHNREQSHRNQRKHGYSSHGYLRHGLKANQEQHVRTMMSSYSLYQFIP